MSSVPASEWTLSLPNLTETATAALAESLCAHLKGGDVLLLEGPIGAGKSLFARNIIRSLLAAQNQFEDIPSPTFTLVQSYQAGPLEIWHSDLYRLSHLDEVEELGLIDAFDSALCLIEWPDRLGDTAPKSALKLSINLQENPELRCLTFRASDPKWNWLKPVMAQASRGELIARFLAEAGWQSAKRSPLAGDASPRRYERLQREEPPQSAVLMDADPTTGEDVEPFLKVAEYLLERGFSAPNIIAQNAQSGLILLEDLGDDLLARVCKTHPALEAQMYRAAVDVLIGLQQQEPLHDLPPYDMVTYQREAALLVDYYLPAVNQKPVSAKIRAEYLDLIDQACATLTDTPKTVVLRDYHAENLLWLPARTGRKNIGLLDFQDALIGHPAYDLVSLLEDARRNTSSELQAAMLAYFLQETGYEPAAFCRDYAILGAQRNLKIIGIFSRLCVRDGKAHYLDLIGRVWGHLSRDLAHPALADLRHWMAQHVPIPDAAALKAIRQAAA